MFFFYFLFSTFIDNASEIKENEMITIVILSYLFKFFFTYSWSFNLIVY
jgi:hypothetical protein